MTTRIQPIYYAGIGSRNTPAPTLSWMQKIAAGLARVGYTLRSGAAAGADTAFEQGCDAAQGLKEIWLPWQGFNKHPSLFLPTQAHVDKAQPLHPKWEGLSQGAKKLHSRNAGQVFGTTLDEPVRFVICWTPDGCEEHATRSYKTGGTGMAISLASLEGIPVFNLAKAGALDRLLAFEPKLKEFAPELVIQNTLF